MNAFGVEWGGTGFRAAYAYPGVLTRCGRVAGAFFALVALLGSTLVPAASGTQSGGEMVSVIVRELPRAGEAAEKAVTSLGGDVGRHIGIIRSFVADVPVGALEQLASAAGVHSVTPNAVMRPQHVVDGFDGRDAGSVFKTNKAIRAVEPHLEGITGKGVDVAMIDTGVVPVPGLDNEGQIVHGPDLSFESQSDDLRYLDTNGHGTHMAGIIVGNEAIASSDDGHDDFVGVAPEARVVSVKVANASGVTDVSQVLAAIDWVVQHRNDNGLNIRVLNLSYGTDGTQDYKIDPLTYAAEVAWRKGIVVVVAAGNQGYGSPMLNNPAYDPYVIAVGGDDTKGTNDLSDDVIPQWSSRGSALRRPDLVAPGKSIASLRNPGSHVDLTHPEGIVNQRLFRGSGTSQAAAVVSGAAAMLLEKRPGLTPDQVKALLTSTAMKLPNADLEGQGAGLINVKRALSASTPIAVQTHPLATGVGSLEAARGSAHVDDLDGVALEGEVDIFGAAWDGVTWSGRSWSGTSWLSGVWNGNTWSGRSWSGNTWSGVTWSGNTWSGRSWSGVTWSGNTWSGRSWSGRSWSGRSWSGNTWSGRSWSGDAWSGRSWSSALWE